jgi:hypothetical protein
MTEKEIEICPFCGKAWQKEKEAPHKDWIKKFIETVLATVAVAVTAIVLRWLGI